MSNEDNTLNEIYNGGSFWIPQMLVDQNWNYHYSSYGDLETFQNLPHFDNSLSGTFIDFDQPDNSVRWNLPPPRNLHIYHTTQNLSDFSDSPATSSGTEPSPFPDTQLPASQPDNLEICFGSIHNMRMRFINDELYQSITALLFTDSFLCCALLFSDDRCKLMTLGNNSRAFAILSTKDFQQLERLRNDLGLRFDGVFLQQQLQAMKGSLITLVDVNVYGTQLRADETADKLATAGYFLQDPIWLPEGIEYDNPQLLDVPYFDNDIPLADTQLDKAPSSSAKSRPSAKYVNSNGIDYDGILDDFARQDHLSQAAVDNRIRTDLLPYQRRGVDFILGRETDSAVPENTLWNKEYGDDDEVTYRHSITGTICEAPRETRGGILADEMGLGKSLTMLSAIMASLSDAESYARPKISDCLDSEQNIVPAKSTLLIVPSALLLDNWTAEIDKHVHPGNVSFYKYHGHRRKIQRSELIKHDIVLTTYGTVAVELGRPQKLLFSVDWYRIVLDEAHIIRNPSTHNFKAVYSLRSLIRWCMSGTPIQNTIGDLATLIRFLRMPYLEERNLFHRYISHKIQLRKEISDSDFENLRSLLKSICLRRNKTVLPMSSYNEETCEVFLNTEEQAEYERLTEICLEANEMMIRGRATQYGHSTVLKVILRMRLLCNNGPVKQLSGAPFLLDDYDEIFALLQQEGKAICHFCERNILSGVSPQDPDSARITQCSTPSLVCEDCLYAYGLGMKTGLCPICKKQHKELPVSPNHASEFSVDREMPDASTCYPTKLVKLCENIKVDINHHKSIIFSFWKKTLNIICDMFEEQRIPYLRLDGDVPYAKRKDKISKFQHSEEGMVLLMTLGIGAMGLNNLSVASHIHILEPQWNPQVEAQAIGRVIRLGQERPVRIIRYHVKNTIERSIRDRQIQKLRLSKAGVHDNGVDETGYSTTISLRDLIHPNENGDHYQPSFSI